VPKHWRKLLPTKTSSKYTRVCVIVLAHQQANQPFEASLEKRDKDAMRPTFVGSTILGCTVERVVEN